MIEKDLKIAKVFNFHVTHICNYKCVYCFCKFKEQIHLSLEDAYKVVDNIERYFLANYVEDGRINLAGGEPLLYPHLDELIDYIHQKHIQVSIITNGSLLTVEKIENWRRKVSCIGISIDSTREKIRNKIGRTSDKPISNSKLIELCKLIRETGIKLKINTVVSKFNIDENMVDFFKKLKPDRLKFFKMQIVEGINDEAEEHSITEKEYQSFISKHKKLKNVISEGEHDMENSYLMINAKGGVILNDKGKYISYGDCLKEELIDIIEHLPLNMERYSKRYEDKVFPYVAKRKICVFGGHPTWVKSLKKLLKNVVFMIDDEITSKTKLSKCDTFWIKNNALSHSFYNKIIEIARTFNIPCLYFKFDGAKSCAEQVIEHEEEVEKAK